MPQFQILESVVIASPVLVMHSLAWEEVTSQRGLHNKDVFEHIGIRT